MNRRIFDWPLVNESSRNKIKRIISKIWTVATILLFFSTRGIFVRIFKAIFNYATIHLREVSQRYPWLVTGVFFHSYIYKQFQHNFQSEVHFTCWLKYVIIIIMKRKIKEKLWMTQMVPMVNIQCNKSILKKIHPSSCWETRLPVECYEKPAWAIMAPLSMQNLMSVANRWPPRSSTITPIIS